MKLLTKGLFFCLPVIVVGSASQAAFAATEQVRCEIEFKINSSTVFNNDNDFEECLKRLGDRKVEAATVTGSASAGGSLARNRKLAQERGVTLSRLVQAKFPEAKVTEISLGQDPKVGKKSIVLFLVSNQQDDRKMNVLQQELERLQEENRQKEQQLMAAEQRAQILESERLQNEREREMAIEEQQMKALADEEKDQKEPEGRSMGLFSQENPHFRIAVVSGVNTTLVDFRQNYMSLGTELAWMDRSTSFRPEIGGKIMWSVPNVSINGDEVNRVMNFYGFVGVGTSAMGLVTGVRGLIGRETIDINKNYEKREQIAGGGEARIGYEWKRGVSLFAAYGLTPSLQMITLDLGVSL